MSRVKPAYRAFLIAIVLLTAVASAPACALAAPVPASGMNHHCGEEPINSNGCVNPGEMHPDAMTSRALPAVAILSEAVTAPVPPAPRIVSQPAETVAPVPREPDTSVLRI